MITIPFHLYFLTIEESTLIRFIFVVLLLKQLALPFVSDLHLFP